MTDILFLTDELIKCTNGARVFGTHAGSKVFNFTGLKISGQTILARNSVKYANPDIVYIPTVIEYYVKDSKIYLSSTIVTPSFLL